jgi:hypothetical protein
MKLGCVLRRKSPLKHIVARLFRQSLFHFGKMSPILSYAFCTMWFSTNAEYIAAICLLFLGGSLVA